MQLIHFPSLCAVPRSAEAAGRCQQHWRAAQSRCSPHLRSDGPDQLGDILAALWKVGKSRVHAQSAGQAGRGAGGGQAAAAAAGAAGLLGRPAQRPAVSGRTLTDVRRPQHVIRAFGAQLALVALWPRRQHRERAWEGTGLWARCGIHLGGARGCCCRCGKAGVGKQGVRHLGVHAGRVGIRRGSLSGYRLRA